MNSNIIVSGIVTFALLGCTIILAYIFFKKSKGGTEQLVSALGFLVLLAAWQYSSSQTSRLVEEHQFLTSGASIFHKVEEKAGKVTVERGYDNKRIKFDLSKSPQKWSNFLAQIEKDKPFYRESVNEYYVSR